MGKAITAEVDVETWSPRDKAVSVYVDERTKEIVRELKSGIPLRSEAEVARRAFEAGLATLPGYAAAVKRADRTIAGREKAADAASRAARD